MKHSKTLGPVIAIVCSTALAIGCDRADDNTLGQDVDRTGDRIARESAEIRDSADSGLDAMGQRTEATVENAADRTDTAANRIEESADTARANVAAEGGELGAELSDSSLTVKTKAALIGDPDLSALRIDVDTRNGVVTLRGEAASPAAVEKATMLVKGIDGVVGVDNQLRIDPAG